MALAERMESKDHSTPEDKQFQQILKWLHAVEVCEGESNYRTTSEEDYKFYASQQDSTEVLSKLSQANRPATVYNEIKPKVDVLIGMAAQSPFSPQIIPIGPEDEAMAELTQGVIFHYRRKMKISDKELDCFAHTVKSGRSMLYFYIDRSNPFKPVLKAERIPGYGFWIDSDSVEYDMSDARFFFIDKWLTEEEIVSFWPKYPVEDIKNLSTSAGTLMPTFYNVANERYRLVECWYRKWVDVYWFVNPLTGQPENLEPDEFEAFVKALANGVPNPENPEELIPVPEPQYWESRMQKIYYCIFSGNEVLEEGESPYEMDMFPAVLYGAYKNDYDNCWFGAITPMKDPQKGINTMRRQLSHLLQTLPKGLLVHEIGAILNIEEYEERSSEPNYHMEVAAGKIDKYKFESQPTISPIYSEFDAASRQSLNSVSGIPQEFMGIQTTSREPGITVRTRMEATAVVLYILFNNYRLSRLQGTRILHRLIQQYVKEPEIVRIQGPKGQYLMQINTQMNPQSQGFNDVSAGEYDFEFDEIMEVSSMRAATALLLNDFAHQSPGSIPPDVILEFTNIPFTVKQRLREHWERMAQLEQENKDADRAVELAKVMGSIREKNIAAKAAERKQLKEANNGKST